MQEETQTGLGPVCTVCIMWQAWYPEWILKDSGSGVKSEGFWKWRIITLPACWQGGIADGGPLMLIWYYRNVDLQRLLPWEYLYLPRYQMVSSILRGCSIWHHDRVIQSCPVIRLLACRLEDHGWLQVVHPCHIKTHLMTSQEADRSAGRLAEINSPHRKSRSVKPLWKGELSGKVTPGSLDKHLAPQREPVQWMFVSWKSLQ